MAALNAAASSTSVAMPSARLVAESNASPVTSPPKATPPNERGKLTSGSVTSTVDPLLPVSTLKGTLSAANPSPTITNGPNARPFGESRTLR